MSKDFKIIVSSFLIAINLLIATSYSFFPNSLDNGTDSNTAINNYIKDNPTFFNVIITEYSSFKISTNLDNYSKKSSYLHLLSSNGIEFSLSSTNTFIYNQIHSNLSLQRKTNIIFPFHDYS